jgi:hypothetical protein
LYHGQIFVLLHLTMYMLLRILIFLNDVQDIQIKSVLINTTIVSAHQRK